ncbi:MAG: hypothetical protein ACI95C_001227, partial [Pseudohongiellaceae bacterium]
VLNISDAWTIQTLLSMAVNPSLTRKKIAAIAAPCSMKKSRLLECAEAPKKKYRVLGQRPKAR